MCDHNTSEDVVYLKTMAASLKPVDKRHYCKVCGLVNEKGARSVKYFINRLDELQKMIDGRSRRCGLIGLTQTEKRLIIRSLEQDSIIEDSYGSSYKAQCDLFVGLVRRYRPNVPRWMVQDLLT